MVQSGILKKKPGLIRRQVVISTKKENGLLRLAEIERADTKIKKTVKQEDIISNKLLDKSKKDVDLVQPFCTRILHIQRIKRSFCIRIQMQNLKIRGQQPFLMIRMTIL